MSAYELRILLLWPLWLVLVAVVVSCTSEPKCNVCANTRLEIKHAVEVWIYQPVSSIVLGYAIGNQKKIFHLHPKDPTVRVL